MESEKLCRSPVSAGPPQEMKKDVCLRSALMHAAADYVLQVTECITRKKSLSVYFLVHQGELILRLVLTELSMFKGKC